GPERRSPVPAEPERAIWIAAERLAPLRALFPSARIVPRLSPPAAEANESWSQDAALAEILRARLEILGPVTARAIAESAGFPLALVTEALAALEAEGFAMRGRFTPGE